MSASTLMFVGTAVILAGTALLLLGAAIKVKQLLQVKGKDT